MHGVVFVVVKVVYDDNVVWCEGWYEELFDIGGEE